MQRFLKNSYEEWKNAPIKKGDGNEFIKIAASKHNTTEEMIRMYLNQSDWWPYK